jgi:hypothetical protein
MNVWRKAEVILNRDLLWTAQSHSQDRMNDLSDYISTNACKVVGTIDTPLYLDEVKENSTLSKPLYQYLSYIPEEAFLYGLLYRNEYSSDGCERNTTASLMTMKHSQRTQKKRLKK